VGPAGAGSDGDLAAVVDRRRRVVGNLPAEAVGIETARRIDKRRPII
jgi:hypothetical protein